MWLRLERQGPCVRALASADAREWFTAGEGAFPAMDPVQIGLHAIGALARTVYPGAYPDGTATRFERFALFTAPERSFQPP